MEKALRSPVEVDPRGQTARPLAERIREHPATTAETEDVVERLEQQLKSSIEDLRAAKATARLDAASDFTTDMRKSVMRAYARTLLRAFVWTLSVTFGPDSGVAAQEINITPQLTMGASTAPRHLQRGMPGVGFRLGANIDHAGLFAEATRWFSTPTMCRNGACAYTALAGIQVHWVVGDWQPALRVGYGFVGPGVVSGADRAFRAGAGLAKQLTPTSRARVDVHYENWRLKDLGIGRFGEPTCCTYGNMDGIVVSLGWERTIWRREQR